MKQRQLIDKKMFTSCPRDVFDYRLTPFACDARGNIVHDAGVVLVEAKPVRHLHDACPTCGDAGEWVRTALMCRRCHTLICGC
jgi:hypothetical protein